MTSEVFTVREDSKVLIAEELMEWADCRHVPVVNSDNQLVGLITNRDLLRVSLACLDRNKESIEQREHLSSIDVKEVMTPDVATVDPAATVQAATRLMRRQKYGCVPVVDSHNTLLGILTDSDLLAVLEQLVPEPAPIYRG